LEAEARLLGFRPGRLADVLMVMLAPQQKLRIVFNDATMELGANLG
jgi:hypothetical protein